MACIAFAPLPEDFKEDWKIDDKALLMAVVFVLSLSLETAHPVHSAHVVATGKLGIAANTMPNPDLDSIAAVKLESYSAEGQMYAHETW
jgi:hypothetical protein